MGDRFDPGKESCYLQYLDANNLYGWVMSQDLPTGGFKWVESQEKLKGHTGKLAKESEKGSFLRLMCFTTATSTTCTKSPIHVREDEEQWGPKAGSQSVLQGEVCDPHHSS